MIKYLDNKIGTQYGLDLIYKVIPNTFKPYKLMSLYCIYNRDNQAVIAALILLKYKDSNSFEKILSILKAIYKFSLKKITTYFDNAKLKVIKNCETFSSKPYIIPCLFHFSQAIIRKMKKLNILQKN